MSGSVNYGHFSLQPINANTTAFCYRDKQFPVMLQGSPKTWANCIEKLCRLVQAGMFVLWVAPRSAKLGIAFGIAYGTLRETLNPRISTADEFSLIHKIGAATFKKHPFTKSSTLLGVGAAAGYTVSRWMPLVPHLATPVLGFCQGFSDGALAATMGFQGLRNAFKTEGNIPLTSKPPLVNNTNAPDWLNAPESLRWIATDGMPLARRDSRSPIHVFNGKTWEEQSEQIPSCIEVNQPSGSSPGYGQDGLWRSYVNNGTWINHQNNWYEPIFGEFMSPISVESYSESYPLIAKTIESQEQILFVDGKWHICKYTCI